MGCTTHSDGDGMVACDGNEIPRPIPSHPITIPFVMVIPSHRITTHRPDYYHLREKKKEEERRKKHRKENKGVDERGKEKKREEMRRKVSKGE